jgi:hypothetical protein
MVCGMDVADVLSTRSNQDRITISARPGIREGAESYGGRPRRLLKMALTTRGRGGMVTVALTVLLFLSLPIGR